MGCCPCHASSPATSSQAAQQQEDGNLLCNSNLAAGMLQKPHNRCIMQHDVAA